MQCFWMNVHFILFHVKDDSSVISHELFIIRISRKNKILRSDDEEGGRGGGGGGGGVIQDDGEKESCAGAYTMSFLVCFTCCCRLVYCKVDRSVGRSVVSLFLCYLLIKVCYLTLCIASCIASAGKGKCCSNI
ncbi:conserved hypothetical protein [Trichinella spiralis]|uniref:hypothetical protein n=1 Tax=Trichinella spiralis TaxID=6334 RepID=UPI0001EFB85B|nr:conserved hypothetical protein [Trichinella spiralis]